MMRILPTIATTLVLAVVLGCTRMHMSDEFSTDSSQGLSARQYQVIGAVVVALCEEFQTTAANVRSTTISADEVTICGDKAASEFIADRFGIQLEEFCHTISTKPFAVSRLALGSVALVEPDDRHDATTLDIVITEPVFRKDGRSFVYAIASCGSQTGGDVFMSLQFTNNTWKVERSTALGIR